MKPVEFSLLAKQKIGLFICLAKENDVTRSVAQQLIYILYSYQLIRKSEYEKWFSLILRNENCMAPQLLLLLNDKIPEQERKKILAEYNNRYKI